MAKTTVSFELNGTQTSVECFPMARLLDVLREAGFTGTKEGCGEGECGACSVFIDGTLVNSCLVPAAQIDGAKIQTIEGVEKGENLDVVQEAFLKHGGAQCGICTPGMVMASLALLKKNPNPDEAEIKEGLAGNLCRCTGYMKIIESVQKAAEARS